MVEYSLILVLAVIVVIVAVTVLGETTANTMSDVSNTVGNAM
ncbi:MAG: pilus assembly protein [Planctomycetota bacterium]